MTFSEFAARAAVATFVTLLALMFGGIAFGLVRIVQSNLEWEKDIRRRHTTLEARKAQRAGGRSRDS